MGRMDRCKFDGLTVLKPASAPARVVTRTGRYPRGLHGEGPSAGFPPDLIIVGSI
jgi:hypothetical protein